MVPRTKQHRRSSLESDVTDEFKRHVAAVEIQRIWRGYRLRRKICTSISCVVKSISREKSARKRLEIKYSKFSQSISDSSSFHYSNLSQSSAQPRHLILSHISLPDPVMGFEEFCVSFIQHWWCRRRVENTSLYVKDKFVYLEFKAREHAAMIIQNGWRSFVNRRIFRYYKDLINFYSKGDPRLFLKSINPKEADLLDHASRTHLRFRLAGKHFPPNIFYKIYTHRAVADINSFAPRDYTSRALAEPGSWVNNCKIKNPTPPEDHTDWYQRVENNGWRLVSYRVLENTNLEETSQSKFKFFHYSRCKRKQEVAAKKRKRKIEWMKSMYKAGKANGRRGAVVDKLSNLNEEEQVDELEMMSWAKDLDFDNYMNQWGQLATCTANNSRVISDDQSC